MFIGHLPAGYLITSAILARSNARFKSKRAYRKFLWIGILASILPDFDLFWFYLIDNCQHLHHSYWTHIPIYWIGTSAVFLALGYALKNRTVLLGTTLFSLNIFGHLFLDTIVGKIRWLYPFSDDDLVFFDVPARYNWWVWNFVFHWTFALEIILTALAVSLFLKRCHRGTPMVCDH